MIEKYEEKEKNMTYGDIRSPQTAEEPRGDSWYFEVFKGQWKKSKRRKIMGCSSVRPLLPCVQPNDNSVFARRS